MRQEPTAKPKRQRVSLDDYLWPIFIAACGGACVKCGNTDTDKFHRAHIQRHIDDGPATLENLQPLCPKCNGEHTHDFAMRDYRPDDWRDRLMKLLAQNLRLQIALHEGCDTPQEGATPLSPQNSAENKRVIAWGDVTFAVESALHTPSTSHPTKRPLVEAQDIVSAAIRLGARHRNPPMRPFANARGELERLAGNLSLTREDFLGAAARYLDDDSNLDENANRPKLAWQQFADNFDDYLADWRASEERRVKREAEEREASKRQAIEKRKQAAIDRWVSYRRVGDTPAWPGMTDADREFIEKIRALPDEQQVVSEADFGRAGDIESRYRAYYKTTKKARLLASITLLGQRLLDGELKEFPKAYWEEVARIKNLVDAASDSDELLDVYQSQLRTASVISRWRAESSEPE